MTILYIYYILTYIQHNGDVSLENYKYYPITGFAYNLLLKGESISMYSVNTTNYEARCEGIASVPLPPPHSYVQTFSAASCSQKPLNRILPFIRIPTLPLYVGILGRETGTW